MRTALFALTLIYASSASAQEPAALVPMAQYQQLQQQLLEKDNQLRACMTRQERNVKVINSCQGQTQTLIDQIKLLNEHIEKQGK